jgi:DNA-directed RNA polymerase subunit RPC12/RpoP
MSSNTQTVAKIPAFHFDQIDNKFINDIMTNIKSKHFPTDGKWFLENFTYFKTGSKLKIDLGRIVKNMSMPDNKNDMMASLSMSSVHLISQIPYIIQMLAAELPDLLKSLNWKVTEIQYMSYDPDFIRFNKYTNTQIKGTSTCQIVAFIEPIDKLTPICKNPDSPKIDFTNIVSETKTDEDGFTKINSKKVNDNKECMTCKNKFVPIQAHYQNCPSCNKAKINVITNKKCSTCPKTFTPEQAHYHNCPDCFAKKATDNKVITKKCSDCSKTFKPLQPRYHQCSECFGKKSK